MKTRSFTPSTTFGSDASFIGFIVFLPKRTRVGCRLSACPRARMMSRAIATASSSPMPGRTRAAIAAIALRVSACAASMPWTENAGPTCSAGSFMPLPFV